MYTPAFLKKGNRIGIAAPARSIDLKVVEDAKVSFRKLGYELILPKNYKEIHGYLAGDDKIRAEAFMNLWKDDSIDAIWCYAGGYGSMRILDLLDYDIIKKTPKIFIGMSDITALHSALQKEASLVTYLGPNLSMLFKETMQDNSFTLSSFFETLTGIQKEIPYAYPKKLWELPKVIKEKEVEGEIVGGNLAMISSLMGTRWQLETENKILLLEDINEPPYKIDRMLTQLRLAGVFDKIKGLILASFHKCSSEDKKGLTLQEVFKDVFANCEFPILYGFPSGHISEVVTIPLGSYVKMSGEKVIPLRKRRDFLA